MATKKINLKKENVENVNVNVEAEKENVKMENAEKMENVETVVTENAENVKENVKMENVVVVENVENAVIIPSVEELRNDILGKIKEEKARLQVWTAVDVKGQAINSTNWGKDITRTEKETMGGYVREMLERSKNFIKGLKRDLKETYFDLLPELKALQNSDNKVLVNLVNNCIENMRNVPVVKNQYDLTPDVVKLLASARIKNIGVSPDILGNVLPVLITNGYVYDMTCPQPVSVDEIKIDGLDYIPSCTYYNFTLAE